MNDTEGVEWEKVPGVTKDFFWSQFKFYITHPGCSEDDIYTTWEKNPKIVTKTGWANFG